MFRTFIAVALSMAAWSVQAQQPQVNLEGTLIRQNGRTVLRAGSDMYVLRFPSTRLMTFTDDLLGEDVRVQGTLHMRSENGQQRAVLTPNKIDRLAIAAESTDPAPIETRVAAEDETPAPVARTRTRGVRRKELVRDVDVEDTPTPFYGRVDRRKRSIRAAGRTGYRGGGDYNDVYLTPGGGVIIRNR